VPAGEVVLQGEFVRPDPAFGVVLFAHGSGSGRHSPRNRFVADGLNRAGLATLLIDLLSEEEEQVDLVTRHLRFDLDLLAGRLVAAIDWLVGGDRAAGLPIGLFGASTGAGAALIAAERRKREVKAVVSRGGRPDLAGEVLPRVGAPTLLIIGGADEPVIELNEGAAEAMRASVRLVIVPGATHLFEEPGALERVVDLARDWFTEKLAGAEQPGGREVR
jgi:putative phosphoribosyl transferase